MRDWALLPLAARLKKLRATAGMSQQSLAFAADLSISVVSQIEQGTRTDPRISTMTALAGALGVTLDDLTGRTTPSFPQAVGGSTSRHRPVR